jgi:hypothetical protein
MSAPEFSVKIPKPDITFLDGTKKRAPGNEFFFFLIKGWGVFPGTHKRSRAMGIINSASLTVSMKTIWGT